VSLPPSRAVPLHGSTFATTEPLPHLPRSLNLFRGVVPPIGGIDISPIGAFFVLNLLTNSVASLGATGPMADRIPHGQLLSRKLSGVRSAFAERVAKFAA
jgi:uncharacterized protein YggT (Ycf19 family)